MIIDDQSISEIEVENLWPNQKMIVALKTLSGKMFIDARKWTKTQTGYSPGKGLMLHVEHWPLVTQKIQEMIAQNCNIGDLKKPKT